MQCKILESRWWYNYLISKRRQKIKKGKFCLHLPLGDYSKGKIHDVLVYYAKERRVFEPHFIQLFIERQSIKNNGMKFVKYSYMHAAGITIEIILIWFRNSSSLRQNLEIHSMYASSKSHIRHIFIIIRSMRPFEM